MQMSESKLRTLWPSCLVGPACLLLLLSLIHIYHPMDLSLGNIHMEGPGKG